MTDLLDELKERGFVALISDEEGLHEALRAPITLYCGFDPSNRSLTVGNLLQVMLLAHFQRAGHRPIAVMGGGTGMIGDPSGKTSQRPLLSEEEIRTNLACLKTQFQRFLDFSDRRALQLDNAAWLLQLRYISFLREIGRHFTVNQLLQHETYRQRLEGEGLSLIEFSYALLQAYDFLHLYRAYDCILQVGGKDQWFNILTGTELIRRAAGGRAFALVTPLLMTASGEKMGKTEAGAVWLDADRTSPYEYYQFWVNTEDADVERFLALFTFLPLDEVRALGRLRGADLRQAKEVLAFEATRLAHGVQAAAAAQATSRALFGGKTSATIEAEATIKGEARLVAQATAMPTTVVAEAQLAQGLSIVDALVQTGLAASNRAARDLIAQGGAYLNGARVERADVRLTLADFKDGAALLRAGKKRYHRLVLER